MVYVQPRNRPRKSDAQKTMERESDGDIIRNWCAWYSHQRISTETGELWNHGTSRYHPNYSIVEIGLNTERSPKDLKSFAVAKTPVKKHQLTLVWKTMKIIIIVIIIIKMIFTLKK